MTHVAHLSAKAHTRVCMQPDKWKKSYRAWEILHSLFNGIYMYRCAAEIFFRGLLILSFMLWSCVCVCVCKLVADTVVTMGIQNSFGFVCECATLQVDFWLFYSMKYMGMNNVQAPSGDSSTGWISRGGAFWSQEHLTKPFIVFSLILQIFCYLFRRVHLDTFLYKIQCLDFELC
jgi:hypothetical protein